MTNYIRADRLAASVSHALALRWIARYREALDAMKAYGGDVSGLITIPPPAELEDRYTRLMREEVLGQQLDSTASELRFLDLIEAIIIDQLAPHDAPVTSDEQDLGYALEMLRCVHGRVNDRDIAEAIAQERREHHERFPEDAELFALIAEWRRLEARANKSGITDDERARRCDDMREVRDKIAVFRPVTVQGVLAALEMASEVDDPDYWPDGAIEGLREIAKP